MVGLLVGGDDANIAKKAKEGRKKLATKKHKEHKNRIKGMPFFVSFVPFCG